MLSTLIHDLVPKQIERLSQHKFQWLSFPEVLETRFEQDIAAYRTGRLGAEGLIAIGFFNLFLFANYFLLHTVSLHAVLVRSCLLTPVALAGCLTIRLNPGRAYREMSIAATTCWICYMHLYLELSDLAMGPAYAQVGVI